MGCFTSTAFQSSARAVPISFTTRTGPTRPGGAGAGRCGGPGCSRSCGEAATHQAHGKRLPKKAPGEARASPGAILRLGCGKRLLPAALLLGRPCRRRSNDPVELSLWAGCAVDRNMGRDFKLQPLDVVV